MPNGTRPRMFEVKVIALRPDWWAWQVCEGNALIMSGYAASRETAQVDGYSALFLLLRSNF